MSRNVTVVNRTSGQLSYMYNGAQQTLEPGESSIPAYEVEKARTQNIVMGSENPLNPSQYVSLVGIKGKTDCSKIEFVQDEKTKQTFAMFEDGSSMLVGIERIDRREFGEELQNVVIQRNKIPLRRYEVERSAVQDGQGVGAIGG